MTFRISLCIKETVIYLNCPEKMYGEYTRLIVMNGDPSTERNARSLTLSLR